MSTNTTAQGRELSKEAQMRTSSTVDRQGLTRRMALVAAIAMAGLIGLARAAATAPLSDDERPNGSPGGNVTAAVYHLRAIGDKALPMALDEGPERTAIVMAGDLALRPDNTLTLRF